MAGASSDEVISGIKTLISKCDNALTSLSSEQYISLAVGTPPEFPILRRDFLSLLSLIHATSTKLALALNSRPPAISASSAVVVDLSDHLTAVLNCTLLFSELSHGRTIVLEIRSCARNVVDALKGIVEECLLIVSNSSYENHDLLVKTGALHYLVDEARANGGISVDNLSAVRKIWKQHMDSLEDALRELGETTNDEDQCNEDMEDFCDESDIVLDKKLSAEERLRSKEVYTVLRLTFSIYKRTHEVMDSPECSHSNAVLDPLPDNIKSMVSIFDDIVISLYPPHELDVVAKELQRLWDSMQLFRSSVCLLLPADAVLNPSSKNANSRQSTVAWTRWVQYGYDQISASCKNLIQ